MKTLNRDKLTDEERNSYVWVKGLIREWAEEGFHKVLIQPEDFFGENLFSDNSKKVLLAIKKDGYKVKIVPEAYQKEHAVISWK